MKRTKYWSVEDRGGVCLRYDDSVVVARTNRDIKTLKMMLKKMEKEMGRRR